MTSNKTASPIEIRLDRPRDTLHVTFDDGNAFTYSAEFLRVHSPSAEVKGHGADERKIIGGKRHVLIADIEPTGNYAIRLTFSDGHSTGIFSWAYLYEIGNAQEQLWLQYLSDLDERGLTRG